MKGIMYDLKLYKVILKKIKFSRKYSMIKYRSDWSVPLIKYPNQVQIKTHLGGICASDLHHLDVDTSYFVSIWASGINPIPTGHEVVGEVTQLGGEVTNLEIGERVVYTPIASCDAYGFAPCASCRNNSPENCYCLAGTGDGSELEHRYGGRGAFGGFGGGGFSEYFVGFEKQLYKVPSTIPDETAVLVEPFAVSLHAVLRRFPEDDEVVVIIGAGIIGLMATAALRALGSKCTLITLAKYRFQAEAAKKLGSDIVISECKRNVLYQEVTEVTGGQLFKPRLGKRILFGNSGPDIIYDCVATESSLDDALHLIRSNGTIVIVGLGYHKTKSIDWSFQVYKELEIMGSIFYGLEVINGKRTDTFKLALRLMEENPALFEGLVTHKYPIEDYKAAFSSSSDKAKTHAIKVTFDFREHSGQYSES
ncbi:MAG: zinc-binding dehydrogenase [Promethearchaeota archaeon]